MDVPHIQEPICKSIENTAIPLFSIDSEYDNTFLSREKKYPFMLSGIIKEKIFVLLQI